MFGGILKCLYFNWASDRLTYTYMRNEQLVKLAMPLFTVDGLPANLGDLLLRLPPLATQAANKPELWFTDPQGVGIFFFFFFCRYERGAARSATYADGFQLGWIPRAIHPARSFWRGKESIGQHRSHQMRRRHKRGK